MEITVSQEVGRVPVTVFKLDGLLNMGTSELLEKSGREAFAAGARYLLIDLNQVESITSAGLRSILTLTRMFASSNAVSNSENQPGASHMHTNVKILNSNPQTEYVLSIAGFTIFLEIYKDRQEAIDSFI